MRALLAYLAIESSYPHHRDRLAALLWPDQTDSNARSNLRKALSRLWQMLEDSTMDAPLFLTTRQTIQLNPAADYRLDVAILTQLLNDHPHQPIQPIGELCAKCVSDLEQAVALYRGPLLDQMQLPDSEAFETWMMLTRQRWHERIVAACAKLVAHYEQQQHYSRAQQYVQRQLQLEPWNEAAHQYLMRVLAQRGRCTAALQQYDRCCKILEQELAVAPAPETIALWEAIRTGTFLVDSTERAEEQSSETQSLWRMELYRSTFHRSGNG